MADHKSLMRRLASAHMEAARMTSDPARRQQLVMLAIHFDHAALESDPEPLTDAA